MGGGVLLLLCALRAGAGMHTGVVPALNYVLNTHACPMPAPSPLSLSTLQYLMLLEQFLKDEEVTLKELTVRLPPLNELIQDYKVGAGR
jgi:hypothetical protein